MFSRIIRYLYYILFLVTPLLVYSHTSELFEFNKMIFIYAMTLLILTAWTVKLILYKDYRSAIPMKTALVGTLLFFLATQIVSTLFSIDIHTSVFGYYGRFNGGLLSIIAYIGLFFVLASELDRQFLLNLLKVSLISSLLVVLWGLPGKFGHDLSCLLFTGQFYNGCWTDQFRPAERMFSTLGQPNWLGAYLAINFFIGLYFLFRNWLHNERENMVQTSIYGGYLILNFAALLFTKSRSAEISVAVGFILFFIVLLLKRCLPTSKMFQKRYAAIALVVVLGVIFCKTGIDKLDAATSLSTYIHTKKPAVVSAPKEAPLSSEVTESFDIRKIVWKGAWQLALRYPLFGTGVETFAYSYYFTRPVEHNMTSEWDYLYNKAHNEYLNFLATTGFVGFIAYMAVVLLVVFFYIKRIIILKNTDDWLLHACLLLSLVSILITNFFGFSTTTINLFFYCIPAMLLLSTAAKKPEPKVNPSGMQTGSIIVLGFVCLFGLIYLLRYWTADIAYAKADNELHEGQYQAAAYDLDEVLKTHYEHVYEDRLAFALAGLSASLTDKDQANKLILASQIYNQKTLAASPMNVLYWKTRANIYFDFYQSTLNKDYLKTGYDALSQASVLAPTDPRIPYTQALFGLQLWDENKKDIKISDQYKNESLNKIDHSIALKPNYSDAYVLKAQMLKKFGQQAEARNILLDAEKKFGKLPEIESELNSL